MPRKTTAVGPSPRAMNVTAVAQPSAASTKNCQGCSPASVEPPVVSGFSRTLLVEVSELIVDALFESGIERRGRRGGLVGLARPLDRGEADRDRAECADQVREQPRQAAEAPVNRRAEHLFGAVLRDECLDDRV